jgi:predicted ATPase/DNA-binding SARP family transcriptional activator
VTGAACRFGVLGPLSFERDGRSVPVPSGRQRSLLALLLLERETPLSRDRLIGELWGERPPASAVSALHVHLSKLRGLLDGLLVLESGGYALTSDFELDVIRFDGLVDQARTDPNDARGLLTDALALFRGDPLCDVVCEGSLAQWRRELDEKRLQAIVARIDADLAGGEDAVLVPELERLLSEHQFEERLWGQLMRALYRAGRQADALAAFQKARQLFAGELGLEPGESLVRLQQEILDRDPALQPVAAVGRPAEQLQTEQPVERPRSNLPRPMTRLVGREHELGTLTGLLADPDLRLLTLTGPGGVGKTRLLIELARHHQAHYRDGAVLVRLERLTDPALVSAEIATALALRDGTDGPSADGLVSYLRDRELLMAIDNFEHLLDAAPLLSELLAGAPNLRVVVSSRTAMRVRGETTFEVEPLALPAGGGDGDVAESPAVQLFLQCALAANRKLELGVDVTQTVARICRALDGLPLAIELAASRSHLLTPDQIAEQLVAPLSIGEHALRDLPDRQQTLQATIRWSYDLLTPSAQEALRGAAVFLGGFTLPALEAVTGSSADPQLEELLEASLVRRQVIEGRFELLELVRAFSLEQIQSDAQVAEGRARHRTFFANQMRPVSKAFDTGEAPGQLAEPLQPDHANLRAALTDAIEHHDAESAVAIGLGMRPIWVAGMLRHESAELVSRLLEHLSIPGDTEVALLRAPAFLDYTPKAKLWHRRIATVAAEIGDNDALVTATGNLFGGALNARDTEEMARLRPELRALITPEASPKSLGWLHYFLALDAYIDGRFAEAFDNAAISAERAAEIGHEFMLGSAVGTRLLAQSARDGAIDHAALAEAIELMGRPSVQPLAAFALWFVARYAAGVAPDTAGQWLAHAHRIVAALDAELWPECVLRDETMAILGIKDVAPFLDRTPPVDHTVALDAAALWLAGRPAAERSPREVALLRAR